MGLNMTETSESEKAYIALNAWCDMWREWREFAESSFRVDKSDMSG